MKLVPMRFKGVEWHHNPREISFECEKQVNELKSLGESSYIQNLGRKNMIISGSGELFGEDCLEQFDRLLCLFKEGGSGTLAIDGMKSICAVFENVKIIGQPKPDVLSYSFVFREVMEYKTQSEPTVHIAQDGECLWDVSYQYQISIDSLIELNPWVKRPDEDLNGREVALC